MESKSKYDYMYVTPSDVAYLIKEYRKNRRESVKIIRDIWYGEGERISPLYRTKLKLFMLDIQFLVDYYEEEDQGEIKAELEDANVLADRNLFNDNLEIDVYANIITYFKHTRLLLLYFKDIYIPRKKYSTLYSNCQASKDKAFNAIKECMQFYGLGMKATKNKVTSVYALSPDYKGYITCFIVKPEHLTDLNLENNEDLNLKELGEFTVNDFSNMNVNDFFMAFR